MPPGERRGTHCTGGWVDLESNIVVFLTIFVTTYVDIENRLSAVVYKQAAKYAVCCRVGIT